uniref:hypothetical protein n=1 Tax=Pseudozobellia sp. WGM2 TaxID=2787625 RepID=UPI001ADF4979
MKEILKFISVLKEKGIFLRLEADKIHLRLVGNTNLFSYKEKDFLIKNKQSIIEFISKNTYLNSSDIIATITTSRDNGYPISDAQRRIWVLSQFRGGSVTYNMPG